MRLHLSWALLIIPFMALCSGTTCVAGQPAEDETQKRRRSELVDLLRRDIQDQRVLLVLGKVPRHLFVPPQEQAQAYRNHPLPIGEGQTISQPFIVGYMTQALKLTGNERVLEVGTGSGYQAAILAELAGQVYSIEILPEVAARAAAILKTFNYQNLHLRVGDGFDGWADQAPFDCIMVTAAPERVPTPLLQQLKEGGRLVIPVGQEGFQVLYTYVKRDGRLVELDHLDVRFVPMTGKALRP
jgi:protein-L-isoaspartate(D-aspartate) O-methyltransferase